MRPIMLISLLFLLICAISHQSPLNHIAFHLCRLCADDQSLDNVDKFSILHYGDIPKCLETSSHKVFFQHPCHKLQNAFDPYGWLKMTTCRIGINGCLNISEIFIPLRIFWRLDQELYPHLAACSGQHGLQWAEREAIIKGQICHKYECAADFQAHEFVMWEKIDRPFQLEEEIPVILKKYATCKDCGVKKETPSNGKGHSFWFTLIAIAALGLLIGACLFWVRKPISSGFKRCFTKNAPQPLINEPIYKVSYCNFPVD